MKKNSREDQLRDGEKLTESKAFPASQNTDPSHSKNELLNSKVVISYVEKNHASKILERAREKEI